MDCNERRQKYQEMHPEWSEDQIWAAVSIEMEAEKVLDKTDNNIPANDPDIIKAILDGAKNWLNEVLPNIFTRVSIFFDKLIATIGDWVQKGLSFVVESVAKLLGKC